MPPAQGYLYKKLSTLNRHQKAARADRAPDINQIELFKPGEQMPPILDVSQERKRKIDRVFERGRDEPRADRDRERPAEGNVLARRRSVATNSNRGAWPFIAPPPPPPPPLLPASPGGTPGGTPGGPSSSRLPIRPSTTATPTAPMAGRIRRSGVKKREALLYLRTNEKDVGVVKMGELPPAVLDMMSRIAPREQVADFLVHDVCDIKQYALLCEQVNNHNTLMAAGYIKPFDDSLRQLKEFTAFLRKRKHAALVYHPDGEVSILYPGKVQEWAFLDKSNHPSMFDVDLRFAVSTALPRLKDLPPRGTAIEPIELGGGDDDLFVADGIGGDGDGDGDVEMRDATPEPPPEEEAPPLPPPPAFFGLPFLESLDQKAIITLLYDKFHITLEELTSVNGDHKPARKFYLGFPENAREFEFLKCALEKCGMEIFSNHSGKDWLTFRRTTEHEPGTVLLHESFADFSALPGFARTLHNHINVFYVSLSQPLASTTATHFDLIFPHGGAILLTDEVITATPKRALAIVKWFIEHAKSRKRGTWKLVFRPNVSHWILELFATTRDDAFAELYRLIEEYTPLHSRLHLSSYTREDSPPASLDGYWSDWDDGEGVLSPFVSTRYIPQYGMRRDNEVDMSLRGQGAEMRNADQLIEWFAGWALMNAERYRRFVAVVGGEKKRVLERWKKWTHIEIADYKQLKGMYPRIGQYDLTNIRMG